jgi:NAD(P)-dependent dehydrogenase (short-subunit alcohol dehydrogenase family)
MKRKTVIVTGASTGLGKAIARMFLDKGFSVVMNSRNEVNLLTTFLEFGSPLNALALPGNIGQKSTGEYLARKTREHFGSIDVLVNNAGVFRSRPFLEVEEEELDRYLSINFKGSYFTSQAVIPHMIENGGGVIINIGAVLVDHAIAGMPATAPIASKGAIHALTRQLAAEFAGNNIRVNAIAPGVIRTPLSEKNGHDAGRLATLHLLNRVGEAVDIAEAVYYLATSRFVSGEILNVDGGHVAGHQFFPERLNLEK